MKRKHWTQAELRRLRHFYPHIKTEHLARVLGRKLHHVYSKAVQLKLRKTEKYLASPDACRLRRGEHKGIACRFRPGHVPANKGLRRPGFHRGRMRETQFKKGQKCHNWLPIGTEVFKTDGYLYRKMTDTGYPPRDWKQVHRLLWEQHYGPILPGYHVRFIDDDRTNVTISNLCLVSRADLAALNRMWNRYPRDLCQVIHMRGILNRRIKRRLKDEESHRGSAGSSVCDNRVAAG